MNINSNIQAKLEDILGENLVSTITVEGGCIANSKVIQTQSGKNYFVKTHSNAQNMFLKESNGLKELAKAKVIRTPNVIATDKDFLLLEYIAKGYPRAYFFDEFGSALAKMHHHTSSEFGFFEDNFIGSTPQLNSAVKKEKTEWSEFYFNKRILAQYKLAEDKGLASEELRKGINKLESKITSILSRSDEPPTLLHGDLWFGNFMCDSEGKAVLIDPAVYYGHREADLAMTKMFGRFDTAFYKGYQRTYPLSTGWEYRENIYLLYHYLNHLNLFGSSYYPTCMELIDSYRDNVSRNSSY